MPQLKGLPIFLLAAILTGCGEEKIQIQPEQDSCIASRGTGEAREAPAAVFLFMGQSNMIGLGTTSELTDEEQASMPTVVSWTGSRWETNIPAWHFGPDVMFMRQWAADHPGETVGIIKCVVGSTSMTDWQSDQWLYKLAVKTYKEAGSLPVKAILWDQGESDADGRNDNYKWYPQMLENLIVAFRADTGFAPFIIGETQYPAARYIQAIQDGQHYVANIWSTQSVCLAETDGFPLGPDNLHFATEGQKMLGQAFYASYKDCL